MEMVGVPKDWLKTLLKSALGLESLSVERRNLAQNQLNKINKMGLRSEKNASISSSHGFEKVEICNELRKSATIGSKISCEVKSINGRY